MLNKDGTLLGRPPLLKPQPLMDSNMSQLALKPTPKITKEFLEGQITTMPKYLFPTKRTTICIITVANGTEFIGTSTCAYEEDVDPIIGKEAAYEHAFGQMWLPYIFAMRQRIYEEGL